MENGKTPESASALSLPSYAFSPWKTGRNAEEQKELRETEEIAIPDGIKILGNYTFYGCRNLKKLIFSDSLTSIGGGSFTGCGALRKLEITMEEDAASCMKDVVAETFHEVAVSIYFRNSGKRAELLFPEYYEEGVENTPARILETRFHGSGYRYRQCFLEKRVDYKRYDDLFPTAVIYEKAEILLPMALGRLLYPYQLAAKAKEVYEQYLKEHLRECAEYYLNKASWYEVFSYVSQKKLWTEETLEVVLSFALEKKQAEAVSFFMQEKRRLFGNKEKSFDL